jgi:hypothetical protein
METKINDSFLNLSKYRIVSTINSFKYYNNRSHIFKYLYNENIFISSFIPNFGCIVDSRTLKHNKANFAY